MIFEKNIHHGYYHLTQASIFMTYKAKHDSMTVVFAINDMFAKGFINYLVPYYTPVKDTEST